AQAPARQPQRRSLQLEMNSMRKTIAALLTEPALIRELPPWLDTLKALENPGVGLLFEIIQTLQAEPDLNAARLVQRYSETAHGQALARLASYEFPSAHNNPNVVRREFSDALTRLLEET